MSNHEDLRDHTWTAGAAAIIKRAIRRDWVGSGPLWSALGGLSRAPLAHLQLWAQEHPAEVIQSARAWCTAPADWDRDHQERAGAQAFIAIALTRPDLDPRVKDLRGMALLLVTHSLHQVDGLARRLVVMDGGACVEQGEVGQLLEEPGAGGDGDAGAVGHLDPPPGGSGAAGSAARDHVQPGRYREDGAGPAGHPAGAAAPAGRGRLTARGPLGHPG